MSQNKIDNMKKNDILTLGQLSNTKKEFLNKIGFENSEIEEFLELVQPKIALIGVGKNKSKEVYELKNV